jgi:nucleotide-binding universal stress UspA family protein
MTRIAHVLVATDLTERSELALERALQLQRETGATVALLHVVEPGLMGDLAARRRSDAEGFLHARLAQLPEEVRTRVSYRVAEGDAFNIVAGEAQAQRASLIVLGEPAKYRYVDLFVGTTAERVVRASQCPVLVAKRPVEGPYRRLLVALDLSEGAVRALQTGLAIAPDAEVHILHAWRPPLASLGRPQAVPDAIRAENAEIRALIERMASAGAAAGSAPQGREIKVDMIEDNPYVALRNESGWPDLMAMGTHAKGRLTSDKIGDLARHMLAEAPCDVLVARP